MKSFIAAKQNIILRNHSRSICNAYHLPKSKNFHNLSKKIKNVALFPLSKIWYGHHGGPGFAPLLLDLARALTLPPLPKIHDVFDT